MSHKYRVSIGRESPRPASRGITTQLEPRRISRDHSGRKSNFCGKNSGFAARREMPAFLYSRQGISFPANAEGIPEHFFHARKSRWLPGIRQKGAADLSADIPARQACGAAMFSTILHGCRAAPPFGLSPKRGQKRFCSPAANGMRPAAHPTPPNRLSKSPFLLMRPAYANQLFSADISVGTLPASAACFGGRCHTAETPSGAGRPLCTHGVL